MISNRFAGLVFTAGLVFATLSGSAIAQDAGKKAGKGEQLALPTPAEVQNLSVFPPSVSLKGLDDSAQLIVTGNLAGGKLQDLSGDVKYEIANDKLARITTAGRIIPLTNGTAEIKITYTWPTNHANHVH